MGASAAIGRQIAKPNLTNALLFLLPAWQVGGDQVRQPLLQIVWLQFCCLCTRCKGNAPFPRPVVRFHRLPALGFPQPANQMPGRMPAGMQVPLFPINL
ncbi:hypothetical protein D3C75_1227460 [compost metagenome]